MRTIKRGSLVIAALALVFGAFGVSSAEAQSIPSSEAQAFLGNWTLAIDAQGQSFDMDLSVTDASGNVAAEVGTPMGASKVSQISKNGEKLVLSFSMDAQGQVIPVAITLTPAEAGLNAEVDFAGGMFVATGKGTKK